MFSLSARLAFANSAGISTAHLCRLPQGHKASPSPALDKVQFGIKLLCRLSLIGI
jgi:hypothetical protein